MNQEETDKRKLPVFIKVEEYSALMLMKPLACQLPGSYRTYGHQHIPIEKEEE